MSWTYRQSTGELLHNGEVIGFGYSGHGAAKNKPECQDQKGTGPIPCGLYTVEEAAFQDHELGPIVMRLTASPRNNMFGRSGFYMHGDSVQHPGDASCGCIVIGYNVRLQVAISFDRALEVTA
jgi:hypothetical protein